MNRQDFYRFMGDSRTLAFLDRDAGMLLDRLFSLRPRYRELLSERACGDLWKAYRARTGILYMNAASEKIYRHAWNIDLSAVSDPDNVDENVLRRADEAAAAELGEEAGSLFREEMPVLAKIEGNIRENFLRSTVEMLDRIARSGREISGRLFGGREIREITSFTGIGGDVHRHGRAVARIQTDAGSFYYKPHDCSPDGLYHELVGRFFADCTVAADCVPGDGCGFAGELVRMPLSGRGELPAYYRRFGILLALFHSIGGNDMHCENFVPCGGKPAAVDMETLFKPLFRSPGQNGEGRLHTCSRIREGMRFTVRSTAILPSYTYEVGVSSPLFRYRDGDPHLPYIGEERFTVRGYEDDFIRGFEEGCRRIIANREEIARLIDSYGEMPIRYLPRSTSYYGVMRRMLYLRKNLASEEAAETFLRRLEIPYSHAGLEVDRALTGFEAECLRQGDIPYFCAAFDGVDLCGGDTDEVIHAGYFEKSAKQMCRERLDRISEADMVFEADVIRNALSQAAERESPDGPFRIPGGEHPGEERIVSALSDIMDRIEGVRIRLPDGTVFWQSILQALYNRKSCGPELDAASVGGFSALCSAVIPGNGTAGKYRACVPEFLNRTFAEAEEAVLSAGRRLFTELSFDFGFSSTVLCCDLMAVYGGGAEAAEAFGTLIHLLLNGNLDLARDPDQLCSLGAALCMTRTALPEKEALIARCRSELLPLLPPAEDMNTVMLARCAVLYYAGGSGTAGQAGAFLKALRARYSAEKAGWPDESAPLPWLAPRGNQAAWIALCMRRILQAAPGEETRNSAGGIMNLALESLMDGEQLLPNDSLYHGNALSVYALAEASDLPGGGRYLERAGHILSGMLDRYEQKGVFAVCPEGIRSFFEVSFARGTPGIGCAAAYYLLKRRKAENG